MDNFFEPDLFDSGAIEMSRYVEDTDRQLDLEERALTNYLNEVKSVGTRNFVYSASIHPTSINMYVNPNFYIGAAASRRQQQLAQNASTGANGSTQAQPPQTFINQNQQVYRPLGFARMDDVSDDEEEEEDDDSGEGDEEPEDDEDEEIEDETDE